MSEWVDGWMGEWVGGRRKEEEERKGGWVYEEIVKSVGLYFYIKLSDTVKCKIIF